MNIQEQIDNKIRKLLMVPKEEFERLFNQYLNALINLIAASKELNEELIEYNGVYQISIIDIEFNFWFEISERKMTYQKGINKNANIHFFVSKEILMEILSLKQNASDAYMKGLIKTRGTLSYALRFRNAVKIIITYVLSLTKRI